MHDRTLIVANPRSRAGGARRRFARLEPALREALGGFEVEWTRAPRDAERIAREAARAGVERIVVAGGDGTLNEVVSGLLSADLAGACRIGILPFGTGGDLARGLGTPRATRDALQRLAAGGTRVIDAGRAHFAGRDGAPRSGYFVNAASAGISGLTTELVNRGRRLGGRAAFALGALQAIARYRFPSVRVLLDGRLLHEGPLALGAACNGRFFGGGMRVAPEASFEDGLLDAVLVPGFSRLTLVARLPRLYRGTHLRIPGVLSARARQLELEPMDEEPVRIELDGEPLGFLPARFEVVPKALTLFGTSS